MTKAGAKVASTTSLCELDDGTGNVQKYVTLEGEAVPAKGDRVVFGEVTPGKEDKDGNPGPETKELDTIAEEGAEGFDSLPVVRSAEVVQVNHADGTAEDAPAETTETE